MSGYRTTQRPCWPAALGCAAAVVLISIGGYFLTPYQPTSTALEQKPPREITALEFDGFVQETEPMSVIVHFVDPAEIHRRTTPNTAAYTLPYIHPCEIFLPTGMRIAALPRKAEAYFVNTVDAGMVAHEFLHCLRGQWHPGGS